MKKLARYLAFAAIAVILGSCSFAIGRLNHQKARLVASAIWHGRSTTAAARPVRSASAARTLSPYVAKRRVLPARPASKFVRPSAGSASTAASRAAARDISASTDIDYITYTIANLDPSAGEPDISDYLDPNYPYIDIYLTPGQNYRITVNVTLLLGSLAATAGANVGLGSSYGDSADIAVPADGSDVWVDLLIHPLGGIVIKNQLTTLNTMNYVDPTTDLPGTKGIASVAAVDPHDKFFYTSDLLLYYFNFNSNKVYQWPAITSSLTSMVIDGTTGASQTLSPGVIQIYAICPDPVYAGWFYVVGFDSVSSTWGVYWVNYDPAGIVGPTSQQWYGPTNDITADLELVGTTVSVTGVAADPYGFAYVTFYNTLTPTTGTPASGLVEFDTYAGGSSIFRYFTDTAAGWTSANSIFTDVMYGGSNVYVLASPNTTAGAVGDQQKGTADVFIFDIYGDHLSTNPSSVAQSYNGTVNLTGGGSLIKPNRFAGMIQNGTLFVAQTDFVTGGTEYLSGVSSDLSSVKSVP